MRWRGRFSAGAMFIQVYPDLGVLSLCELRLSEGEERLRSRGVEIQTKPGGKGGGGVSSRRWCWRSLVWLYWGGSAENLGLRM